jgi:Spx/MgsR family transcriptional regulator
VQDKENMVEIHAHALPASRTGRNGLRLSAGQGIHALMLTLYGIPNCDTVKKARAWAAGRGLDIAFHDYRKQGVPDALGDWVAEKGWEVLLNRAGTTFRALPEADRAGLDAGKAIALMQAQPAMIKRPVLAGDGLLLVGFKPEQWAAALG